MVDFFQWMTLYVDENVIYFIGDCRITFVTENLSHLESIFLEL